MNQWREQEIDKTAKWAKDAELGLVPQELSKKPVGDLAPAEKAKILKNIQFLHNRAVTELESRKKSVRESEKRQTEFRNFALRARQEMKNASCPLPPENKYRAPLKTRHF